MAGPTSSGPTPRELLVQEFIESQWRLSRLIRASVLSRIEAESTDLANLAASITPHQRQAVMVLARLGPRSMGELARDLLISASSATELVDRLVDRGWVEREADPGDRRSVVIRLTERASEPAAEVDRMLLEEVAKLLAPLGDAEMAELVQLLRPLVAQASNRPRPSARRQPPSEPGQ